MLDVHPPEHTPHGWRDFLIHIATIVVGLLIAVGLEQAVEYLHHRHELGDTRDVLARERDQNIEAYKLNTQGLRYNIAVLRNDLLVLVYVHDHPTATRAELPGVLRWDNYAISMSDIAWRTAQTASIVPLMGRDEASRNAELYESLSSLDDAEGASWKATSDAQNFTLRDPDPTKLSGAALDHVIDLVQQALLAKYRLAIEMQGLNRLDPGFSPAPTPQEISAMGLVAPLTEAQKAELAAARKQTEERLAPTPAPAM